METQTIKEDLELKDLSYYSGTEHYYDIWGVNVTDGIKYVMRNGYSWLVTDFLAVFKNNERLKQEPFLSIKLKLLEEGGAVMEVTDGNDKILYEQNYEWTDAKTELNLFCCDNVLLLSGEY